MKRTFSEYVEKKEIDSLNMKIAESMVELDINPWDFIIEMYSDNEDLVNNLKERKNVIEEGIFSNIGSAVRGVAGTVGNWLGQTAKSGMETARAAGQQARAAMFGPEARYSNALEALTALSDELSKNQKVQDAAKTDPRYKTLVNQLEGIRKQLDQHKTMVTDLLSTQVNPAAATGASTRLGTGGPMAPAAGTGAGAGGASGAA
jgi:hypothetical protein